jgi:hypothetical protein
MKTIVAHIGPDCDAITSIWLVKMFFPGWEEANLAFVPAGTTLGKLPPDDNPEILHVDTGFGKFDHHQTNADICAATLVYEEIKKLHGPDPALERLTRMVNDIDHFREVFYPNPTADFWEFGLVSQIDGWRLLYSDNPIKIVDLGMNALDGIYKSLQNKIWAEKELKEKGVVFDTKWGKGIGVDTSNDDVVRIAQKMGYVIALRKDPKKGYLRVKALPREDIDLEPLYNILKEQEPDATWFLHASHHMLLNGSSKNPDMRPTQKTVQQVIDVIKQIK